MGFLVQGGAPPDASVSTDKIVDDAVTLAKMAAGTDGNIISYDTSGNPVAVATGTDGQVLTSSGAGAVCAFEDAAGGAWAVKSSGTFTTASSLDITGVTTKEIRIVVSNLIVSASSTEIIIRTSTDGGSTFDSGGSDYTRGSKYVKSDNTEGKSTSATTSGMSTNPAVYNFTNTSGSTGHMDITLPPSDNASEQKVVKWEVINTNATNTWWISGAGARLATADVDAIQIFPGSGTISGTYTVLELN